MHGSRSVKQNIQKSFRLDAMPFNALTLLVNGLDALLKRNACLLALTDFLIALLMTFHFC